jgi:hypothetical protein
VPQAISVPQPVFDLGRIVRRLQAMKHLPDALVFILLQHGHVIERRRRDVQDDQAGVTFLGERAGKVEGPLGGFGKIGRVEDGSKWQHGKTPRRVVRVDRLCRTVPTQTQLRCRIGQGSQGGN